MSQDQSLERVPHAAAGLIPEYYIAAKQPGLERRPLTIKYGRTFGQFDHFGDIREDALNPEGLFHNDTRHLSRLELLLNDRQPLLLGSNVERDNALLTVDLANPDEYVDARLALRRDIIHVRRVKFLWGGTCYERVVVHNFDVVPHDIALSFRFDGDFKDIFEVRGHRRARRGSKLAALESDSEVRFRYRALDGQLAQTAIRFEPVPARLAIGSAEFELTLGPQERQTVFVDVRCDGEAEKQGPRRCFYLNMREDRRWRRAVRGRAVGIESSDTLFNEVVKRAVSDLYMLTTDTEHGPYPFAGIPWFSTVFGRDGIITALMVLWFDPEIGRGVLRYLAAHQAVAHDPESEAEPGKVLHEMRAGEMARTGEVPFGRYYGSVDATPLFVMLAGEYLARTGDLETMAQLWPNIEAALRWIDEHGDPDGDGFVEYGVQQGQGLVNQGWKDSEDAIFHADGALAAGPIALCEVQGYVYAARRLGAKIAGALGKDAVAETLAAQAAELRERFEEAFWCEDLSTYALALDGAKRPCRVRTSNPGHLLLCGIVSLERARRVADTLLGRDGFSGWGVRTVAASERRYNPMGYHNGSVWPHDNALIALGLARYGLKDHVRKVFSGLFDAATYIHLRRLPELFCGFNRRRDFGPTYYPTACAPQAWASASLLAALQALLGLAFDPASGRIRFNHPMLPDFLEELRLSELELGETRADVVLRHQDGDVAVNVARRSGDVRVVVVR